MTLTEARKILGLGPDEDLGGNLTEFKNAREEIAKMVKSATSKTQAEQYEKGLAEFDEALAVIQNRAAMHRETAISSPMKSISEATKPNRWKFSYLTWILMLGVGAAVGTVVHLQTQKTRKVRTTERLVVLEREAATMLENRRWQDATQAFAEIDSLAPGSEIALKGRRNIEAGMAEEQTQFVAYWIGQATAELETGRLDEATASVRQVLDKYPAEKEATVILDQIAAARAGQSRAAMIAAAREALDQQKWAAAISNVQQFLSLSPEDSEAKSILGTATAALEKAASDLQKAAKLLEMAVARDQGKFDQQALDWLREAKSLAPEDAEISARLEKLASYTRTIRIPEDAATPAEALAIAHDRDRIILTAGTWKGPLSINTNVELQGAGSINTIIECSSATGSAITIGPGATETRVSGIRFRHDQLTAGGERFSVALVRSGHAIFTDCRFTNASGHGLAVIEGGRATITRSRFSENGWNGAAIIGKGSSLDLRDSESLSNYENGIESWDGASVTLINNRCEANSRNGIHADNGLASAVIEGNQLIANREFGLVLGSAGSGAITKNIAQTNTLGGFVIRATASKLLFSGNQSTQNQGPGMMIEKGLAAANYADHTSSQNIGQQTLVDVNFSTSKPSSDVPRAKVVAEPTVAPR
jgi:tetratricopeptide (TPR) repeat protein